MTTRLPDAEIDELDAAALAACEERAADVAANGPRQKDPSWCEAWEWRDDYGAAPAGAEYLALVEPGRIRSLALEVRERRADARADERRARNELTPDAEQEAADVLRRTKQVEGRTSELRVETLETLLSELTQLRARVGELEIEARELRESNRMLRVKLRDAEVDDD